MESGSSGPKYTFWGNKKLPKKARRDYVPPCHKLRKPKKAKKPKKVKKPKEAYPIRKRRSRTTDQIIKKLLSAVPEESPKRGSSGPRCKVCRSFTSPTDPNHCERCKYQVGTMTPVKVRPMTLSIKSVSDKLFQAPGES